MKNETFTQTKIIEKGRRFVQIRVRLEDQPEGKTRLSVTGSYGRVLSRRQAKSEALAYWVSYFEEEPQARHEMNDHFGRNFRTARTAAKFVLDSDGEFHGLDIVEGSPDPKRVLVVEGCGAIHDEIRTAFPEYAPLLEWHLNDLHPGCEQAGHDREIAAGHEWHAE